MWTTLLLLAAATTARAADLAKCYKPDGTYDAEMKPCDPTAQTSTCCRPSDFCLSNGLCLGGGGNNGFSQQGCTKPGWDFPCHSYCSAQIAQYSDGFQYLSQCSSFDANATNPFCCGGDYSCCKDPANIISGIAKFTTMSRSGGAATTASVSTTTVMVTVTPTASPGSDSNNNNNSNSKVVAVGAGVGASLGAALLGVVGLLVWQMRKHKKQYSAVNTPVPPYTYSGNPKPSDTPFELSSPPTELPATPHHP